LVGRRARPNPWFAATTAAGVGAAIVAAMTMMRIPVLANLDAGFEMRRDFAMASARLIAARPVFGVGIGQYYPLSGLVLSPWLATVYGNENAHNYFLQISAELGL